MHVSPAPPGNTGDGLRLGESVGATVQTDLPHSSALVPISRPLKADGTLDALITLYLPDKVGGPFYGTE